MANASAHPAPPEAQAAQQVFQLATGYIASTAIQIAVRLGIADQLSSGPRTAAELAAATGVREDPLYRVLRALVSFGIFAELEGRRFALAPGANARLTAAGCRRMTDLAATVRNNQIAIAEFLDAVRALPPDDWNRPRAHGKWSPAQVVEHVALVYELGLKLMKGTAKDPSAPRWLRPVIRTIIRRTVLRTGRFMKSKTAAPFHPQETPAPRDALVARLEEASRAFERSAVQEVESGRSMFEHPAFGRFGVADYVQFQAYHTRHHQAQLRG